MMGCKVDILTERHDLTVPGSAYGSIDECLVARWTGTAGRSSEGYKSLTEWFNKRLLKQIYEAHGRDTMSVHLDREYEVLMGENDVQRGELAADLATDDLDIDDLKRELVSWSTMRHHLKGCLEAEKEIETATTDWEANTLRIAQERTEEKARSVLSSLASKERLLGATRADVQVQIKLTCSECSVRIPFEEAVDRGYICETHSEAEPAESAESVKERLTNTSSVVAVPYGILGTLQSVIIEDLYLVETILQPTFGL